jgi:anti-anti-sigma factor
MELQSQRNGTTNVLRPTGRIDHGNSEDFLRAIEPHLALCSADKDRLVFDLSALEYISSAGLRCFMLAAKQARAQGGVIVIAALRPVVKEIFEISRFTLLFEVFDSVTAAVDAVSQTH